MRSTLNTIRYADGKIAYARVTTSKSGYFLGFDNTAFCRLTLAIRLTG
ncbi:MAG: hypothetical protein ACLUMQ_00195 [Streptococcus salivarius]